MNLNLWLIFFPCKAYTPFSGTIPRAHTHQTRQLVPYRSVQFDGTCDLVIRYIEKRVREKEREKRTGKRQNRPRLGHQQLAGTIVGTVVSSFVQVET